MLETAGTALGIFALRVIGNMLTTLRLIMNSRGEAVPVFFIAVVESVIFALALGFVVVNINSIPNLAAYSIGFAVGGYLGLALEKRLLTHFIEITIISTNKGREIAEAIREIGLGATETEAHGARGNVTMVRSVIEGRQLKKCMVAIHAADPQAFITTTMLQRTERGIIRVQPGLSRLFYP